jgi:hypothetical protein
MSPASLVDLQDRYAVANAVLTLGAAIERLERATWTLVVRDALVALFGGMRDVGLAFASLLGTQLAQPLWPGRVEIRLGTVIVLGAAIIAAFGADKGWEALGWVAARIPSVQIGTTEAAE